MNLLIVESPSKAKTIEKYLGKGWRVIASVGHVRDLVPENGHPTILSSVVPFSSTFNLSQHQGLFH